MINKDQGMDSNTEFCITSFLGENSAMDYLVRTIMPFREKLRNRLLGLNNVVVSEKIENWTFRFEASCLYFNKIVENVVCYFL